MPSDQDPESLSPDVLPPEGDGGPYRSAIVPLGRESFPAPDQHPEQVHNSPDPSDGWVESPQPQERRWLHPASLLFDVLSHLRSYLVPFVMAIFGVANDEMFWQYLALLIFVLSLVRTLVHYLTLRYQISGNDLMIHSGLIFRRVRTIPVRKIQNVDLVQNLLHRALGVAEVRIETASGAEADAVLRVLSLREVDSLRQALFPNRREASLDLGGQAAEALGSDPRGSETEGSLGVEQELLRIRVSELMWAGLSSDRGFLLVGLAIGAFFQFNNNWMPDRAFWRFLGQYMNSWLTILLALMSVWVLLKLFGVVWCLMRFFDYRLTRVGDDLRIASGLLTRVSATIPRQRIQFISVHRPLVYRWRGLSMIKIETAGGAGKEGEHTTALTRSWFVPAIPAAEVARLLGELRPQLDWRESEQAWRAVSPLAPRRLRRVAALAALVATIAGGALWPFWGAAAGPLVLPLLILWARRKSRAMSYARTEFGVAYRSGLLTRKLSLAFFERIQSVKYRQTPFDRRWRMASLAVDTAAAGPAEHLVDIPYLDQDLARAEFEDLRHQIAQRQFVWS